MGYSSFRQDFHYVYCLVGVECKMRDLLKREKKDISENANTLHIVQEYSPSYSLWSTRPSHLEHDLLSKANNATAFLMAYEAAIQLAPREASLHYHKARTLEALGRFSEAAQADKEAQRLGYNNG